MEIFSAKPLVLTGAWATVGTATEATFMTILSMRQVRVRRSKARAR